MLVYTVKRGDTLWQIAKEYQISLDALLAANPLISDPNYILPGSRLNVPRLANISMAEGTGMGSMMEREMMMERELAEERDLEMERELAMELELAEERQLEMEREMEMEAELAMEGQISTPPATEPVCTINGARPCIYITKGGETLHSISEEWGVPLAQLHYHNYQHAQNAQLPGGERIIMPLAHDYRISMENFAPTRAPRNRRRR